MVLINLNHNSKPTTKPSKFFNRTSCLSPTLMERAATPKSNQPKLWTMLVKFLNKSKNRTNNSKLFKTFRSVPSLIKAGSRLV